MKWILVVGNSLAAIFLVILGQMAVAAHRTHAYSTYRGLIHQQVLVERADVDVAKQLESIDAGGRYYRWLAYWGASICLANAVLIAASFPRRT